MHGHLVLAGHWLILAALLLYIVRPRPDLRYWLPLLVIATLIHFYLLVMVSALWAADRGQRLLLGEATGRSSLIAGVLALGVVFGVMWQLLKPMNDANTLDAFKKQVIQLGLDFSLMTQWTAFIAVSEQIYNVNPHNTPLRPVPLPMVEGVSALAYPNAPLAPAGVTGPTFSGQATPEPAVWGVG